MDTSITFTFKLAGSLWDPGYDINSNPPFSLPEPNTQDAAQFDEKGYWYTAGNSDGEQGQLSKVAFIPPLFQLDYTYGYNDGVWKRKVYFQG